jgi:acryloyl-coenzyme A reductase
VKVLLDETGFDKPLRVDPDGGAREPDAGEIQIQVEACGVCYRDLIDRAGRIPYMQLPVVPGHEAVGRVVARGQGAADFAIGDRVATMHRDCCGSCSACLAGDTSLCDSAYNVFGLLADGGYATGLTAPQSAFYRAADDMDGPTAATLHCTYGTAFHALHRFGPPSGRLLVTGANGGVGAAAIELGVRLGMEVVAVIRDEKHREFVTQCGASEVIVSTDGAFHKSLSAVVDIALECVGQPTFNSALRSLRFGGAVIVIGNVVPERARLNLGFIVTRGLRIAGNNGATRSDMAQVLALHAQSPIRADIDAIMPFCEAEAAQQRVRAGGLQGRIVLTAES